MFFTNFIWKVKLKSVKSTAGFRSKSYQVTLLTLFLFPSHLEVNSYQDFSSLCCTLSFMYLFLLHYS